MAAPRKPLFQSIGASTQSAREAIDIISGVFAPTVSVFSGTSVSAVTTPGSWLRQKVGTIVTISGQLHLTVASSGLSVIHVDNLPDHNSSFLGYFVVTSTDATKATGAPGSIHNNTLNLAATGVASGACDLFIVAQYSVD